MREVRNGKVHHRAEYTGAEGFLKSGEIWFDGNDLAKFSEKQMRKIRAQEIRMIFQDPMTSLNPTMPVGRQIMEGVLKYGDRTKEEAKKITLDALAMAGIPSPEDRFKQYPHEFSGGMRQRAMIALAMAVNPKLVIADEPTTALDVTIQAQILDLIRDIQKKHHTSVIMITHDLGVVANIADDIAVMYAGKVVEYGSAEDIFEHPAHPYTWGFCSRSRRRIQATGSRCIRSWEHRRICSTRRRDVPSQHDVHIP